MAPNFVPFTGFSYATGLASLGQGLNRLSDFLDRREERGLLEKLGQNPTAAAAFAAGQPALGLGLLKQEQERRDQLRTQEADRRALGLEGLGGGSPAGTGSTSSAAPASSGGGAGPYAGAISNIESGGRYDILGPVTKTGDRAYGKYQVMGANIPAWTREILGQEMTPEQFRNNPAAQDAVFKGKFGQYAQKYGPEGAARAWFAGEGGMNDLNRRDQLGTTVGSYGRRFMAGYGGQGGAPADGAAPAQPVRVASAAPMVPSTAPPQTGTPPTPEEIRAGQADGTFPPGAVPEFIVQQYQREPVYRQMVDQWRAQRGGQPTQVAAASPQDAAAADAARVQAQGGPRMVLSPGSPLTQGGVTGIAPYAAPPSVDPGIPRPGPSITSIAPYAQPRPGQPSAPIQDSPSIPNDGPGVALAYNQPRPSQLGMQPPAQPPAPPAMPGSPQQIASVSAALRPQAPPQAAPAPSQIAGAGPADMPAPGAQTVQQEPRFTIPGTNETVPASASQRLLTLRQQLSVPNISTELRQRLMTDYRDEIGNLRTLAKEERELTRKREEEDRKIAREEQRGPASVQEFVWARRNGMTKTNTPAEYEKEKADLTKKNEDKALPAEVGARVALAQSFLDGADDLRRQIAEGGITGPWDAAMGAYGRGAQGELLRRIRSGSEAIVRHLTGAGMNQGEAVARVSQYEPTWRDSAATVLSKFDMLRDQLLRIEAEAYRGRGIPESRRGRNPYFEGAAGQRPAASPQPSAAPGAPARQQSQAIREGATATNPQTGQRIRFIRGQWVPET